MTDLVRNSLFPSCEEISSLAAQFGVLPDRVADTAHTDLGTTADGVGPDSHMPIPGILEPEYESREVRRRKAPLEVENREYERLLQERRRQEVIDHIDKNIVSI